jgi:NAD(P)-dependent dehydrogenase (short-subunit alcohol dehydrogenase family)
MSSATAGGPVEGDHMAARPVCIVTGGSRGIGAATAQRLAADGWDVCLSWTAHEQAAQDVAARCYELGASVATVRADVSREEDVLALFAAAGRLGPLRGLVNNAGILAAQTRVEHLDAARMQRILAVNVTGALLCAREAVRSMSRRYGGSGGAIVNVSSRAAVLGGAEEYVDYAASKAALDAVTTGLSKEVAADGLRVNGVRPGLIRTDIHADGGEPGRPDRLGPQTPMRRAGEPGEVAAVIAWLLSDDASYVTGTFVDVAGGR